MSLGYNTIRINRGKVPEIIDNVDAADINFHR